MSWFILLLAGLFEIGWAVCFKTEDLWSKPRELSLVLLSLALSMGLLAVAVRSIPLGTAYAAWTGIGIVGTVIAGAVLFNETITLTKVAFLGLILVGVIGLRITGGH